MSLIDDNVKKQLQEVFSSLEKKVTIKYFTQEMECRFCREMRELLSELEKTTDKIELKIFDFVKDKEQVEQYGVDKIPAAVILDADGKDYGIKFYGIPAGYEFTSLIEAIRLVSTGKHELSKTTMRILDKLQKDVHLQVFVTPTCPYCPGSVILAQRLAFYSPHIKGEMVEASEFPHLSQKYKVMGVPRTVINETEFLEGAAPENMLVQKLESIL